MNHTEAQGPVLEDSLPKIIRQIPGHCLRPSEFRSFGFLLRDFALVAFFAWSVVAVDSWFLGPIIALFLGAAVGGLFVIGHDCGHRSFSRSTLINDIVGHIVTSPVLWPFHVWRLDHDAHHRHTSNVDRDTAWRPVTFRLWKRMPPMTQKIYLWTRSRFFFMGSFYTTWVQIREALKIDSSTRHTDEEKKQIKLSMAVMFLMSGSYLAASFAIAGWYGFFCLFLIPQCVFHFLLSTFTYFHHTAPDVHFFDKRSWRPELAQLTGSIHVAYPRLLEFFCHDINWHVPHHVCVGVPHYHLREAHVALKTKYPQFVRERVMTFKMMKEVTSQCHFVKSKMPVDMSWTTLDEVRATQKVTQTKQEPALGNS